MTTKHNTMRWIGWAVWMTALISILFYARNWALNEMNTPEAQKNWTEWKEGVEEEVKKQEAGTSESPIARRAPKSTKPPAFVLMHDYFGICLGGVIVFGTILYWVCLLLLVGAITSKELEQEE